MKPEIQLKTQKNAGTVGDRPCNFGAGNETFEPRLRGVRFMRSFALRKRMHFAAAKCGVLRRYVYIKIAGTAGDRPCNFGAASAFISEPKLDSSSSAKVIVLVPSLKLKTRVILSS